MTPSMVLKIIPPPCRIGPCSNVLCSCPPIARSCHEQFQPEGRNQFHPETRHRAGARQRDALSQRERRIPPRPRGAAGRGDRASPPHRARRRTAPRAAAGRRGQKNYAFEGENGKASFADLFGDKDSLVVYTYMYGPQRERPCPMCTSLLSAWDGEALDVQQRVALAIVARSPIARLVALSASAAGNICRCIPISPASSAATITA